MVLLPNFTFSLKKKKYFHMWILNSKEGVEMELKCNLFRWVNGLALETWRRGPEGNAVKELEEDF